MFINKRAAPTKPSIIIAKLDVAIILFNSDLLVLLNAISLITALVNPGQKYWHNQQ
ncbi:hypothetical protein ECZU23_07420 [Escherichia coli]|nr:hypothetical protein ECZU23_07420 [Escherichia coli]